MDNDIKEKIEYEKKVMVPLTITLVCVSLIAAGITIYMLSKSTYIYKLGMVSIIGGTVLVSLFISWFIWACWNFHYALTYKNKNSQDDFLEGMKFNGYNMRKFRIGSTWTLFGVLILILILILSLNK